MSELLAYLVSEMKDDMPDVPLPPEVNLAELAAGDDSPMYVTLPILEVGAKSDKGFSWAEQDVDRVVAEINTKRPEGNFGHIKPEDRSTAYHPGKVRWLGATRIGNTAYAKCYVPKYAGDAREYFRVAKATQARVGTSVYGLRGKQGLRDMNLETLDFGHPDRLGSSKGVVPKITSEFEGEKEDMDPKDQLIAELQGNQATYNLIVAELKLGDKPLEAAKTLVSEIAGLRKDKSTLDALVSEMALDAEKPVATAKAIMAELGGHRQKALVTDIDAVIAEMVKDNEPLRPYIREFMVDDEGKAVVSTLDAAKARIKSLLERDHIKNLAKTLVSEQRGPNAFVRRKDAGDGDGKPDVTPEGVAAARASTGI